MAELLKHAAMFTHMCYYAEFRRSALKDVGINTEPQNWATLELRCLGNGGVTDSKLRAPP